jgi:hypothetical protein
MIYKKQKNVKSVTMYQSKYAWKNAITTFAKSAFKKRIDQ